MASEVEICNLALARIGNSRTINSFDERSKEADLSRLFYFHNRDVMLSDFQWSFAKREVSLALLSDSYTHWDFAYRCPVDCLRVIKLIGSVRNEIPKLSVDYELASDQNGRVLLTNDEYARMLYTARVEDASIFDNTFIDALSWKIAGDLALPLSAHVDLANNASQQYAIALTKAKAKDLNEQNESIDYVPETISARLS